MTSLTYVEIGPYGALTRAAAILEQVERPAEDRIIAALGVLNEAARRALAGTGQDLVDLIAVIPGESTPEARQELTDALSSGDAVELHIRGRVVGALQARPPAAGETSDAA